MLSKQVGELNTVFAPLAPVTLVFKLMGMREMKERQAIYVSETSLRDVGWTSRAADRRNGQHFITPFVSPDHDEV